MSEPRAHYGPVNTTPPAQRILSDIVTDPETGRVRFSVEVFPRPGLHEELKDQVVACFVELMGNLHQMRDNTGLLNQPVMADLQGKSSL